MRRIPILAVASMIAASRASAADLPVPGPAPAYYPVVTVYDWGGGYIGINGGYAFGQSEWGSDPLNPSGLSSTGNFNINGGLVGGTMASVGSLAHGWSALKAILIGKVSAAPAAVLFAPASSLRRCPILTSVV
jgi:hypothetical protein